MSNDNYQYFIGIGLPKKEDEFFNFLKQQFHANGNVSSPAHITIIPPFFYENEEYLIQRLSDWAKTQSQFTVVFKEVGNFRQAKYGTIYFAPNLSEPFKKIFDGIHQTIPHLPRKRGGDFIPHLTVANRAPLNRIEEIMDQLNDMQIILNLKVKDIVIYRRKINENWNSYKKVDFNSGLK